MTPTEFGAAIAARWPGKDEVLSDAISFAHAFASDDLEKIVRHMILNYEGEFCPKVAVLSKIAKDAKARRRENAQAGRYYYWRCLECGRYLPYETAGPRCLCGVLRTGSHVAGASTVPINFQAKNRESGADQVWPSTKPPTPILTDAQVEQTKAIISAPAMDPGPELF